MRSSCGLIALVVSTLLPWAVLAADATPQRLQRIAPANAPAWVKDVGSHSACARKSAICGIGSAEHADALAWLLAMGDIAQIMEIRIREVTQHFQGKPPTESKNARGGKDKGSVPKTMATMQLTHPIGLSCSALIKVTQATGATELARPSMSLQIDAQAGKGIVLQGVQTTYEASEQGIRAREDIVKCSSKTAFTLGQLMEKLPIIQRWQQPGGDTWVLVRLPLDAAPTK